MAGANGFYSPASPLKACQGPAYTTHRCSVSQRALTLLPPFKSLHAYWLYRVCACYGFIEGFLMCSENCLMIGVMMPVGVPCLSTLSPMSTEGKRPQLTQNKLHILRCVLCFTSSPAIQSLSGPPHVNQNYTTSTGLSPGGCSSPCLPYRTAFSCPSIMSAGDIQA